MPHCLWCNLDPDWPFAALVHDHCLDLLSGADTWVWDLAEPSTESLSPWPDWPLPVIPGRLLDTLDDLPETPPLGPPLLVLINAPASASTPRGEAPDLLADLAQRLAARRAELMVTLPAGADSRALAQRLPTAWLVVRLPESTPLRRLHAQRLLMELARDPTGGAELRSLPRPGVLDLALDPRRQARPSDGIAQGWGALLPGLLVEAQYLLSGHSPATAADSPAVGALDSAFEAIERQRAGSGHGGVEPPEDALAPLLVRAGLFYRRDLAERLRIQGRGLLVRLDAYLGEHFDHLAALHQGIAAGQPQRERILTESLATLTVTAIGLGVQGQTWLTEQARRCQRLEEAIQTEAERLMGELERDLRPGDPRPCGTYLRHRFPEDEHFDTALSAAQTMAGQLLKLPSLIWTWALTTLIAAVPVLATRLPGWRAAGPAAYLTDPARWVPDLLWILLPGLLLVLGALFFAVRRRRALGVALAALQARADQLWQRHAGVLETTFHYGGQVLAMRELGLIRDQLGHLRSAVHMHREGLMGLEQAWERQRAYYQEQGLGIDHSGVPGAPGPLLEAALAAGARPRDWVSALVANLPPATQETLSISDHLTGETQFVTRYLRGYESAQLRSSPHP